MKAQSREPETGRSVRQCRTRNTAETPGGLEPRVAQSEGIKSDSDSDS